MDLKQLFTDDDAVSPVIGVILMVAITVILAAVIASLVLGLGDEPQQTPSAQFEFDYNNTGSPGNLTIAHNGGQTLDAAEIEIRGDNDNASAVSGDNNLPLNWTDDAGTGITEADTTDNQISTGDRIVIGAGSGYDVTVTYVPSSGGNTAPLADDQGPGA